MQAPVLKISTLQQRDVASYGICCIARRLNFWFSVLWRNFQHV